MKSFKWSYYPSVNTLTLFSGLDLSFVYLHTWTSSSFLTGMDLTPYLVLSSLERGADMRRLLMWEGAEKCLFLDLDRSEETCLFNFIFWNFHIIIKSQKSHRNWRLFIYNPNSDTLSVFHVVPVRYGLVTVCSLVFAPLSSKMSRQH